MSKSKSQKSLAMCIVIWHDASMEVAAHWQDGHRPRPPKARDHICQSVGWLTHLDDDFAQLTQTLTDGQHANVVNIPRGMVRSITALRPEGA